MSESAFGVEHGEFSKADQHGKDATIGRLVTGGVLPGAHAATAGRKGKKLRAAGYELGGAVAGSLVVAPPVGAAIGTHMAHNKGYYKRQKPGSA